MKANHISVCVCTFKRPELLTYLLQRLNYQQTEDLFTYSVVVADNDPAQSARQTVEAFLPSANMPVKYCHESEQNIAMTRNKSLQNADGEFIAFIDDDEYPVDDWLLHLFKTRLAYEVAGVLGPVKPYFQQKPPKWAEKGRFFDRPSYPTGYVLNFSQARTGNVLFKAEILAGTDEAFRTEFDTAGEDIDFFRRMMDKGFKFVWCDEAVAHELVPNSRCTRRYLLSRALLRGSNFLEASSASPKERDEISHCGAVLPDLLAISHFVRRARFSALPDQASGSRQPSPVLCRLTGTDATADVKRFSDKNGFESIAVQYQLN